MAQFWPAKNEGFYQWIVLKLKCITKIILSNFLHYKRKGPELHFPRFRGTL